jgi:DNA-binding ferritin-like protein (Dps family)
MEAMRQSWTDDRLDALNEKVDRRFDQVDRHFDRIERDDREFRLEMKELPVEMNERFDSMQRTMLQIGGVVVAALLGIIATQL